MSDRLEDNAPTPRGDRLIEGIDYSVEHYEEMPTRSKIIAELADRVKDLHELDNRLAFKLLYFLFRVFARSPEAWELVVAILAGYSDGGKSLAVLGDERGHSKQNVHQTRERLLETLGRTFPHLMKTLREIVGSMQGRPHEGREEGES